MAIVRPPAEEDRWRALIAQDPARVVELLRMDDETPMTDSGDTGADLAPALRAVLFLADNLPRPGQRAVWDRLVEAGVADALCAIISDKKMLANEADVGAPRLDARSLPFSSSAY